MADDGLISGAAAPARARLIRSQPILDSIWVLAVSTAVIVSSFVPLIDLPTAHLQTGEAPLRVYVLAVPIVAMIVAVAGIARRSTVLVAIATGIVLPGVALAGSLGGALFFDASSAFADIGVPAAMISALLGVVMIARWFVYHPVPLLDVEARPTSVVARILLGIGVLLILNVAIAAVLDASRWSISIGFSTFVMLLVPTVVVIAAIVRTTPAFVLMAAAASAQLVAVLVARIEESGLGLGSELALRTGAIGLVGLAAAAGVAIIGVRLADLDDTDRYGSDEAVADDESWRWSADE